MELQGLRPGMHSIYLKKTVFSTGLEALQLIKESVAESYGQPAMQKEIPWLLPFQGSWPAGTEG